MSPIVQATVAISGTDQLWDMTATVLTPTQFVVCIRRLSYSPAHCMVGVVNTATQNITFGTPLDVPGSSNYINGYLAAMYGSTSTVVFAFALSNVESSLLAVLGVAGSTVAVITPGSYVPYQYSCMTDNLAMVSLSNQVLLLTYRVRAPPTCQSSLLSVFVVCPVVSADASGPERLHEHLVLQPG